jgi:hypothetical protein
MKFVGTPRLNMNDLITGLIECFERVALGAVVVRTKLIPKDYFKNHNSIKIQG